jgi:hypothetical protein
MESQLHFVYKIRKIDSQMSTMDADKLYDTYDKAWITAWQLNDKEAEKSGNKHFRPWRVRSIDNPTAKKRCDYKCNTCYYYANPTHDGQC